MNKLYGLIHNICIWKTIQYVCIQKKIFLQKENGKQYIMVWFIIGKLLRHSFIGSMQKQKDLKVQKKILVDKKCWKVEGFRVIVKVDIMIFKQKDTNSNGTF